MAEQDKVAAGRIGVESVGTPSSSPPIRPPAGAVAPTQNTLSAPVGAAPRLTLPLSMVLRPATGDWKKRPEGHFLGELDEDFDSALGRVDAAPASSKVAGGLARLRRWLNRGNGTTDLRRRVAFDGFTSALYDEKTERDRRYGTVYTVVEQPNGYLVRLELPRVLPRSALKSVWQLDQAMPDYDYSLKSGADFLIIRGSVAGEALRRLSYVSASSPADFMTRIDFREAIDGFVHRRRDQVIELIVFKRAARPAAA
jgi:hypothetical protein